MKGKLHIFESKTIVILFLLLLLQPAYFGQFILLDKIYTYGSFVCTIILISLLFKVKIGKSIIWIMLFYGVALLSTVVGSGEVYQYMHANFSSLAMCLLFYIWLEKNPSLLIDCFSVYEIFVYINFVTILLFPDGLYSNEMYTHCWFLGYKNPQIRTILPILSMSMIRSYREFGRLSVRTWCLGVCTVMTFILNDSATSLVGIAIFLGLLFLFHKRNKQLPRIITLMNGVFASIVAFVVIVVLQMQYIFVGLIEGILGRDLTFTKRVSIWSKTVEYIKLKLILGYGYISGTEYSQLYNNYYATHPHNYYMYIAMTGGVILVIILLTGFYIASKKLSDTIETVYSKIILFSLFSFLVMGLTEALVSTILLYPMLILAMEAEKIAELRYENNSISVKFLGKRIVLRSRYKRI